MVICAVASSTMCGHALAGAALRRKKLVAELLTAMRILRIEIASALNSLEYSLKQTDQPLFVLVSENLASSSCVLDAWMTVRNRECVHGGCADCLSPRVLSALDRLFEQLGISGREEQAESVHNCILTLEESYAESKERAAQVGKLYTSLGFLAGLSLSILMI